MSELGARLQEIGKAELWTFSGTNNIALITSFVTGCVGILAAQIYWQRCFAAKDSKTARNGLLYSGIIAILMVMLTALVGMVILTLNQELKPDDAMPWLMMHYVPTFVAAIIFALILAAGMSSADSNLNSACVLIVNDLIRPFHKKATDNDLVKYAKILTVIIGIFAAVAAIYASSILGLFSKAYAMAGGGLVPLLLVGLLWKERSDQAHTMGKKNSKVTPWGARIGIVAGAVLTQITALGPNRVLIALVISAVLIVVVSIATQGQNKGYAA
ncbi:SSS sodium solute transporter superfamily [Candidatus Vecturithrix granuli]|uniref:SSS sodium solute transporter superfamily n=1 Tax=Vecturithrix granuli TaxID=1499967 RepID=A0A081C804_VECG1|nr:SSS sodium solute transporter superfamily [Candidatus Vecturithrix granuli]